MTKHSKKDIVKSLQSRFPRLAEHIERSAAAIEDAYKMVRKSTVESYKRDRKAITTMANSGMLPGAVAKFFIGQLVDPVTLRYVNARAWLGEKSKGIELYADFWQTTVTITVPGYPPLPTERQPLTTPKDFHIPEGAYDFVARATIAGYPQAVEIRKRIPIGPRTQHIDFEFPEVISSAPPTRPRPPGPTRPRKQGPFILSVNVWPAEGGVTTLSHPEAQAYPTGKPVTITAQPNAGWRISHWRVNGIDGNAGERSLRLTMDTNYSVLVIFTEIAPSPGPGPGPHPPGPGPPTPPQPYGSITGRVMDEATVYPDPAQSGGLRRGPTGEIIGNGIPGARVKIHGVPILDAHGLPTGRTETRETYTDGYGRYKFDKIAPGHYTLIANTPVAPPARGVPVPVTPLREESMAPYHAPIPQPFVEQQQPADVAPGQPCEVNFTLTLRAGAIPLVGRPAGAALRAVRRHVTPSTTEIARIMGTKFINSAYRDVRKVLLGKGKEEYRKFTDDLQRRVTDKGTEVENLYRAWQDSARRVEDILRAAGQTETANEMSTMAAGAAAVAAPEAAPFLALADRAGASTKGTRIEAGAIEAMRSAFELFKKSREDLGDLRERPYEVFEKKFKETIDKAADAEVTRAKRKWRLSEEDGEDLKKLVGEDIDKIVRYYTDAMERGATEWVARALNAIGYTAFSWGISSGGDKVRDTMGYFLKEWWGPIAWGVLYAAGLSPWQIIVLIIWAFMKIPLFTGFAIGWLQIAFLVGGTVLGLVPLPGYTPAPELSQSNIILLAIIGGFGNWLMNMKTKVSAGPLFEGTPFGLMVQQLTHFVSGAIIVLGVEMLMMGLGFDIPPVMSVILFLGLVVMLQLLAGQAGMGIEWMPFLMILSAVGVGVGGASTGWFNGLDFALFLIFLMLGMTNFYPAGGIKTISVIAVGVLLFSYFAMGPYAAYVHEMTDQFKQPLRMAWGLMRESFTGIWLLLTNPTEYYARQQLVSVRTERPLSWPQGIEITSLTAVPEGTIPAGQGFTVFMLAENKGDFTAENVRPLAWCPPTTTAIGAIHCIEDGFRLTDQNATDIYNKISHADLAQAWRERAFYDPLLWTAILKFFAQKAPQGLDATSVIEGRVMYTKLAELDQIAINILAYVVSERYPEYKSMQLRPGQAERWSFDFTSQGRQENESMGVASRAAETVFNKVMLYLEYTANTSTSLQVEVANKTEIDRRAFAGETPVYKYVLSISKVGPAQVSLNVGPQPLQAGSSARLILSVSNARPDGNVILAYPATITLKMSKTVGTNLQCPPRVPASGTAAIVSDCKDLDEGSNCVISIYPDSEDPTGRHVIRPYEFKDIFALSCTFNASSVEDSRTGLVTAELSSYKFVQLQQKSITVGPRLGVFAPGSSAGGVPEGTTVMGG